MFVIVAPVSSVPSATLRKQKYVETSLDPGETIIEHVSNSGHEHPLLSLPTVLGGRGFAATNVGATVGSSM